MKCLKPVVTVGNHTGPTKEAPALLQTSVLQQVSFLQNRQWFAHAGKVFWVRTGCSVIKVPCEGFRESTSAF